MYIITLMKVVIINIFMKGEDKDVLKQTLSDLDYLQVFELKPVGCLQSITHISEEPEYHMEYLLPMDTPIADKVYIIDDGDHSTMLLANEY